jgi:hypothetical protein
MNQAVSASPSAEPTLLMRKEKKYCRLLKPVRDREGRSHFRETPLILQEIWNLDRVMYLVRFDDGSTTLLFPDEIEIFVIADGSNGRCCG